LVRVIYELIESIIAIIHEIPIHLVPLQKYELTQFDQCPVPCYDHVLIMRGECQMVKEWTHYNYVMIAVVERAFPSKGSTS
jgi:hypothetical protein